MLVMRNTADETVNAGNQNSGSTSCLHRLGVNPRKMAEIFHAGLRSLIGYYHWGAGTMGSTPLPLGVWWWMKKGWGQVLCVPASTLTLMVG